MRLALISILLIGHWLTSFAQTVVNLNPNSVVDGKVIGGSIPAISNNIVFSMWDGVWSPTVSLPTKAQNGSTVQIKTDATYTTRVLQDYTDVPVPTFQLSKGQSLKFYFVSERKRWEVYAPTIDGTNVLSSPLLVNTAQNLITRVQLSDGYWNPAVVLPSTAIDGAIAFVASRATWSSKVDPRNLLFPYTAPLRTGDDYAFIFNASLAKWVLAKSPETLLKSTDLTSGTDIPTPVTAVTRVKLDASTPSISLRMPEAANDRDRVVMVSQSSTRSNITIPNVTSNGTMTIGKGESYEFMWDAGLKKWVILQAPTTLLRAGKLLPQGVVPETQTPTTTVQAWDGNWARNLTLPAKAKPFDRVVVKSSATWSFTVAGTGLAQQQISTGEEVVFVYGDNGTWQRETDTIRILLSSGQGVIDKLGLAASQTRQLESLRLTNEALANSGSKFRFQLASLLTVPNLGSTLGDAVVLARTDSIIQAERKRVAADSVYYEGVESGCGLAWVNYSPNEFSMVATGSLGCGTTVMRHELGHNMGLNHGNGVSATVMSGNALPYFATPNRYSSWLLPLGYKAVVPDEVAVMDKNAPFVAKFR